MPRNITISPNDLTEGGLNAPRIVLNNLDDFPENQLLGAAQYRYHYEDGPKLDALLVNKKSDTLVVSLHGLSLIHISEPTRRTERSRMPSSA